MITGLISVIIPVYNRREVIGECLSSVLTQSYQNFEIIITDDGSSDNTLDICRKLAESDPRIHVISLSHAGVSSARNAALEAAKGEYVFFLDSDDAIHPLLFETFVTDMQRKNAAIAGTSVVSVYQNSWAQNIPKMYADQTPGETDLLAFEDALTAMLTTSSPFSVIGGIMMHRNLIGETRFRKDLHIGEDFFFIYQNLAKGAPCLFLKQKWYFMRIHSNNSSWDYSFNGFQSRILRRKLVWENEEAEGRAHLALQQKRDAFGCFVRCYNKCDPQSEDAQKMRGVLRDYKKALLPAMTFKGKIAYLLYVYFPGVMRSISRSRDAQNGQAR